MSLLKKFFGQSEEPIESYADFWNWFQKHEKKFFELVKDQRNIEKGFFDKLSPKLLELKDGYFFLTGMSDDHTVELVLTADGNTKNIVFIEELVAAAPSLNGWKFTALKPALDIEDVDIGMAGYNFNGQNIHFYANETPAYPDEIDITIIHDDLTEENQELVSTGIFIFLDNFLGELQFVTNIDNLNIIAPQEAQQELVPIAKLKDFLSWRQKEFTEKYQGVWHNTEEDNYSALEAELPSGNMLVAIINTDLLKWDRKASHPWVAVLKLQYDGSQRQGMPNEDDYEALNKIEEEIVLDLKDVEGYLNIGRQTAEGERLIYFACKDFRKPSKVLHDLERRHKDRFNPEFEIYKDKYWQSFERFQTV